MNDLTTLMLTAFIVSGIFFLIYLIDRRTKQEGGLFTRPPSRTLRVLALLLGFILGAFSVYEMMEATLVHLELPLVAMALIAYGFGASDLLMRFQGTPAKSGISPATLTTHSETSFLKRLGRLLIIFLSIGAGVVAIIYALLWMLRTPATWFPFSIGVVLCVGGAIPFAFVWNLIKLSQLAKRENLNNPQSKE